MKAYPKYKDSGNSWIKNIPEHWSILSLKRFSSLVNGSTPQSATNEYWDGDIVWITPTDLGGLKGKVISSSSRKITEVGLNNCGASLAPKGSIILSTRAPIGHLALTEVQSCTNQGCKTIVPDLSRINNVYLYYYLFVFKEILQSLGQGSTFVELSSQNLKDFASVFPPLSEQQAIADFLDRKTAQIDTLIAKKQRQIDLLQEQRTALINHAVTKGLNPDTPMKDSGVEWLGEIPSHWELSRLKFICSLLKDGTHLPPSRQDTGIPLLSVRNIVDGKFINLPDDSLISKEDYKILTKPFEVLENDVLLAIVGATLGKVAIVEKMSPFFIQRSLAVFRPKPEIYAFKFLYYFFRTSNFQSRLWSSVGFSAQPGIYLGTLANIHCPIPSIEEQQEIISFIEKEDSIALDTINNIRKQIELLKEYRTALISEAVTGKIDVRE